MKTVEDLLTEETISKIVYGEIGEDDTACVKVETIEKIIKAINKAQQEKAGIEEGKNNGQG